MFTRVILAAGVAALAISAPAGAKPDRERGGQSAQTERGSNQRAQRTQRVERQSTQRAERTQRVERQARAPRMERTQRTERVQMAQRQERPQRAERQQRQERAARLERQQRVERQAQRVERAPKVEREARSTQRIERQQVRVADRANRTDRQQVRNERQMARADREQIRNDRIELRNERIADRRDIRAERFEGVRVAHGLNGPVGYGVGGCPPGLANKGCMPPGQTLNANRFIADAGAFRASRLAALSWGPRTRIIEPVQAVRFVGAPLSTVSAFTPLAVMPSTISYLYPDTNDYYYRYGGGYVYRVDRDDDLIDWVLPMLASGFMPGQYLPNYYMNSYVPNYYGFNSFYPSSYGAGYGYGYGYDNLCNRYANGVVYQIDCATGLIVDATPLYAGGYGVGQMLPSSYGYYNVPYQYRSLYYNTNDYNYWYAPGAIYQYDPGSSMITSVAALLSPGLTIGQPLPMGYSVYNVPYSYRTTYYDTPNAWYRYNNGYIYQVDPMTQLVTAIVASILT